MSAGKVVQIDANLLRDPDIQIHGLNKADDVYTFYYDETNNVRRLYIREDGLNVPDVECFALGGVVHRGTQRSLDIAGLRSELRLQKNLKEIKFKNVAKGTFPEVLSSKKLATFLEWIGDQDLLVHFFVLDPIYWMVVDIIDGILMEGELTELYPVNMNLKTDLYAVLRHDRSGTVDLFRRHSHPEREKGGIKGFVIELQGLIEARRERLPDFGYQMLKGVLEVALRLDALSMLESEISNVVIDRFGEFYAKRVCLFKNSSHIFDAEEQVQAFFEKHAFLDHGQPLKNYSFLVSEQEPGVQMSDVVVGLIGRFFGFVNGTPTEALADWSATISPIQRSNLAALHQLMDRSVEENDAFAHYVLSLEDFQRGSALRD